MFAKDVKELITDIKRRDYKVIYKKDYDLLIDYINELEEEKEEMKGYVTNKLKEFERLINTSPIPSFYQLPYGVCVSFLNKIENGGSNG